MKPFIKSLLLYSLFLLVLGCGTDPIVGRWRPVGEQYTDGYIEFEKSGRMSFIAAGKVIKIPGMKEEQSYWVRRKEGGYSATTDPAREDNGFGSSLYTVSEDGKRLTTNDGSIYSRLED